MIPRCNERTYETSVILVQADSKEQAELLAQDHFIELEKEITYTNALGGIISWRFVCILDSFELVDDIPAVAQFTEVYSRYIIVDPNLSDEEVVDIYFKGI